MKNTFCCPLCKSEIIEDMVCCGYTFQLTDDRLVYDHERLLFKKYPKDFFLNKTLNTNGHLSYYVLPEGSVSLSDRPDVQSFSSYISDFYSKGHVVDIGCGPLEVPGYLVSIRDKGNTFYGVDPMPDIKFDGIKIIGCCEFLPFQDDSIDTLIFATTIDHVCNLNQTFNEAARVLKRGGKMICWHWYNNLPFDNFKKRLGHILDKKKRYYPYPNGISFVIPRGAQDPYHREYINPKKLYRLAKKNGFSHEDTAIEGSSKYFVPQNNYFITFVKN